MNEPIQDKRQETTDLLAPTRCEKCGYLGHSAPDCEYPWPQGHASQQRRDQDWSLLGGQVFARSVWDKNLLSLQGMSDKFLTSNKQ